LTFTLGKKGDVKQGDAENPPTTDKYDLIFNHIPYLNMVKYGEESEDMSNFDLKTFLEKMRRIFLLLFLFLELLFFIGF
jgi:hypothetical protein